MHTTKSDMSRWTSDTSRNSFNKLPTRKERECVGGTSQRLSRPQCHQLWREYFELVDFKLYKVHVGTRLRKFKGPEACVEVESFEVGLRITRQSELVGGVTSEIPCVRDLPSFVLLQICICNNICQLTRGLSWIWIWSWIWASLHITLKTTDVNECPQNFRLQCFPDSGKLNLVLRESSRRSWSFFWI